MPPTLDHEPYESQDGLCVLSAFLSLALSSYHQVFINSPAIPKKCIDSGDSLYLDLMKSCDETALGKHSSQSPKN